MRYQVTLRQWTFADQTIEVEAPTLEDAKLHARQMAENEADEYNITFENQWPDRITITDARRVSS